MVALPTAGKLRRAGRGQELEANIPEATQPRRINHSAIALSNFNLDKDKSNCGCHRRF